MIKNDTMYKKVILLTSVVLFFIFILIFFAIISVYKSSKIIYNQANLNLVYLAENIKKSSNNYFSLAEQTVKDGKTAIEFEINGEKLFEIAPVAHLYKDNEIPYVSSFLDNFVSPLFLYLKGHAKGVMSIFFDFDHELVKHQKVIGTWYVSPTPDGKFKLIDNGYVRTMYPEAREDLSWYYLPKKLKKGVWSKPYTDEDLKIDMITYSEPVYIKNKFIGVTGVDISMQKIKEFIYRFKVYKSGKAYLVDKYNEIIYAHDYKPSTSTRLIDENLYKCLGKACPDLAIDVGEEEIKLIKSAKGDKLYAITKLKNDFFLVLEVPKAELYGEINRLILFIIFALILAILIAFVTAVKAYIKIKKINETLMHKEKLISIGTIAAGIAHEINTPIGYIDCNLDTLKKIIGKLKTLTNAYNESCAKIMSKESLVEEEFKKISELKNELKIDLYIDESDEIIDESREGIKKISEIILSLKTFSKDDRNGEKTFESIEGIIEGALRISKNKLSPEVKIIKDFDSMPEILCNRNQLKQVFINLIDNANYAVIKNEKSEKIIKIRTFKKGQNACIEIEDNGIGIDKNVINRVFDSFFTTKAQGEGTGLGLSISHAIITKKHKGEIFVESKTGEGSKFIVQIPYL